MPQKTPRHHVQRTHHQRRGPKQNSASHWTPRRPPDHSQTPKTEMVRPHNKINRACQDGHARYSPRRGKTRQTEKDMGRQYPGMDGLDIGRRHEESGETRGVEGAGCQVICGAPTVHCDYGIGKARQGVTLIKKFNRYFVVLVKYIYFRLTSLEFTHTVDIPLSCLWFSITYPTLNNICVI